MSDERWKDISRLYHEASALDPAARDAYLRGCCGEDEALLREVRSLLLDDSRAAQLLDPQQSGVFLIGQRLGVYEVQSLLGVGGMGEVYRARDTKLGREVAIKVLPQEFASDADRLSRFEREARMLASLNHPYIAGIHGFEDAGGVPALVLELVEGETLAKRLTRGAMPISDALVFAGQLAEAIEAAHEQGVVHRDLKPANITITPAGTVKVLDFGLAKLMRHAGDERRTMEFSRDGMIVGTAAYMSPEQARGRPVDKRTDIWAFGCVLYEMLAGKAAFAGETMSDTLAGILDSQPDWEALPDNTPPAVCRLLHRCLEKDSRLRLRDIGDARLDIADALAASGSSALSAGNRDRPAGRWRRLMWRAAGLLLSMSAVGALAWTMKPGPTLDVEPIRFSIIPPSMPNPYALSVSPDGRLVAFPAVLPDGRRMIVVRPTASLETRPIAGTEGALNKPFWSPDSRYIGFVDSTTATLKVVKPTGGVPEFVAKLNLREPFLGGTWNSDNVIIFGSGEALYRVPATGGVPTALPNSSGIVGERASFPWFLPDGRHYLYVSTDRAFNRAIFVGSLGSRHVTRLMQSDSKAVFAPPHFLLFMRQRKLLAQRFDAATLTLAGEPVAIADGVLSRDDIGAAAFAVSPAGTLAYRSGSTETGQFAVVWIDRRGNIGSPIRIRAAGEVIGLSPDGTRVAFSASPEGAEPDIWTYDLERNLREPLTNDPSTDHLPVWSPDGSRIAFDSTRTRTPDGSGGHVLYEKRADGAMPERPLIQPEPGMLYAALDWTSDYVLFSKRKLHEQVMDIWAMPLSGERKPFPYLTRVGHTNAALSPNGRWLAYVAHEGGTSQVVVRSFPDLSQWRHQISSNGGAFPRWRRDGRELFYLDSNWRMVAVPIEAGGTLRAGSPINLFASPSLPLRPITVGYPYGVTPDGQRFLFSVSPDAVDASAAITVVMNWPAGLNGN